MLKLYMKRGCPYCKKVLEKLHGQIAVPFCAEYIRDDKVAEELVNRGGKRQVPYLVDEERGVEMYESEDINEYIETHYG